MPWVNKRSGSWAAASLAGLGLVATVFAPSAAGSDLQSTTIARGAGTTIIQGGTGKAGGFVPVLTTLAFHAEQAVGL